MHYHHPLQRDLGLDQATEQGELEISGVRIESIVTATGCKSKKGGIRINGV
jgi:hypothetical protein